MTLTKTKPSTGAFVTFTFPLVGVFFLLTYCDHKCASVNILCGQKTNCHLTCKCQHLFSSECSGCVVTQNKTKQIETTHVMAFILYIIQIFSVLAFVSCSIDVVNVNGHGNAFL